MLKEIVIGHDAHPLVISSLNDTCKREVSFTSENDAGVGLCHKGDMTDEGSPLYRLLMSIKPESLTVNAWAKRADVNRNFFQSVKNGSQPIAANLEKVVQAIGYTPAQFYDLQDGKVVKRVDDASPKSGLPFQRRDEPHDVPLVGTAQGSDFEVSEEGKVTFIEKMDLDMENVIDHVRRPASLANRTEVYAITVVGDSMADRYRDGDPAYVDAKRQPRAGDYVIVQLVRRDDSGEGRISAALLKQLVRRTSTYTELCQTNPPAQFVVPNNEIAHTHRVIPWSEIVFF
ncbi:S24 family peptidase [Sphingobium yanoikuyae]|jgi:phage repressor protein C with HTH and peptisase S24 domain|uniref:S24 family peptidase n=1 Tax=Sphingobium yanoikuyae TaxID=13690 RepID=A0A6M4G1F4_SPHYA|nr:S24 family peptidase [Sphingobium yanoikuyae]QJR00909.1 S24 family peptidase [Sphingobium yanoikuyae]